MLLFATSVVLLSMLVALVLKPSFLYAHKTECRNFSVYHNKPIDPQFSTRVESALQILRKTELYDSTIKFEFCLNDGSVYPALLEVFLGKAFALGFTSDKIAICGDLHCTENEVEVNGHRWNLVQLLAHEATHCLVYKRLGFWRSNPVAGHPKWKWEGYPEYISRLGADQGQLTGNIEKYNKAIAQDKEAWDLQLPDGSMSPKEYFRFRLLNQYCFEIKRMSFVSLLKDTTSEESISQEMNEWFAMKKK